MADTPTTLPHKLVSMDNGTINYITLDLINIDPALFSDNTKKICVFRRQLYLDIKRDIFNKITNVGSKKYDSKHKRFIKDISVKFKHEAKRCYNKLSNINNKLI